MLLSYGGTTYDTRLNHQVIGANELGSDYSAGKTYLIFSNEISAME